MIFLPLLLLTAMTAAQPPCRDRYLQPFASTSIWNTAIGQNAVFMPASIYTGMDNKTGCQLRINSPSRRRQCPGLPPSPSQQVDVSHWNLFIFIFLFYFILLLF